MKIQIQAYWEAQVQSVGKFGISPEELLKEGGKIKICDIAIDGKVVGGIMWDGKELSILSLNGEKTQ